MGNNNSRKDTGPVAPTNVVARLPQTQLQPKPIPQLQLQPRLQSQFHPRPGSFSFSRNTQRSSYYPGVQKLAPLEHARQYIDRTIKLPNSYDIWQKALEKGKVKSEEFEALTSRISTQSEEFQREQMRLAEERELERIRQTTNLFTQLEASPKPKPSINSCISIDPFLKNVREKDIKYFSPKRGPPDLTPEQLNIVLNASRPNPSNEILCEIEEVQISRKDIQTLLGLNWLNDEIIYAYMLLLVNRGKNVGYKKVYTFNTFFYPKLRESGYSSVRRWTRKVDIFSYDFVLMPVHLGNHWCLAVIDFTERIISYYDSLGGYTNGCCDTMLDYLREESKDKKKQDFDDENWRLVDSYTECQIPKQMNSSDCGVFACTYAEYLTRQAKLTFSQEHMPKLRKKMIYEIVTKKVIE